MQKNTKLESPRERQCLRILDQERQQSTQMNGWIPEWMTHGRTVLCQKDPRKGNTADNYRPITCLPLM